SYAVLGELIAWMVGWALILEYAVAAGAVAVGWSGYANGFLREIGMGLPIALTAGPGDTITLPDGSTAAGSFNLIAFLLALLVTWLLYLGTSKSAKFTAMLVIVKIVALTAFVVLAFPAVDSANFEPMLPNGWGTPLSGVGVLGAAASIFFAYVGFDAVSTAAEETKNPNRNIPIGLIGSLAVCTVFYLLVAYAAVGAVGAQPGGALSQSKEPLAFVLREIGWPKVGSAVAIAAIVALPSVVLMMIFGQTRILFTMARDGLLPEALSKVHPKYHTPHVVTWVTGIAVSLFAAMFPVGMLADISNSGTLFAFFMVAVGVMVLRKTDPGRVRPFRAPLIWIIGPLAMAGCVLLFFSLGWDPTIKYFCIWAVAGLVLYFVYARRRSHLAPGNEHLLHAHANEPKLASDPLVQEGPNTGP
ncbi:MAG: amino acid permease, partial [Pseudomonadota bacterium]|nr:amino acid permease [Pseudomonadota bacterium]